MCHVNIAKGSCNQWPSQVYLKKNRGNFIRVNFIEALKSDRVSTETKEGKKSNLKRLLFSAIIQGKETLNLGDTPIHVPKIVDSAVDQSRHQTFHLFPKSMPCNTIHALKVSGVSAKKKKRERCHHSIHKTLTYKWKIKKKNSMPSGIQ